MAKTVGSGRPAQFIMAERLDEIQTWAKSRIRHIENDSRYNPDKPASIHINTPLALIQIEMETEHRCLTAVVKMAQGIPITSKKERRT